MFSLSKLTQKSLFLIPIASALLANSELSTAQIYKWRDDMGRMQYSDMPPVNTNAKKATPNEVINFLQQKDLCTIPQKPNHQQKEYSETFVEDPFAFFSFEKIRDRLESKVDRLENSTKRTEQRMKAAKESGNISRYRSLERRLKRQEQTNLSITYSSVSVCFCR